MAYHTAPTHSGTARPVTRWLLLIRPMALADSASYLVNPTR